MTSTTDACSTGTATVVSGRASASASPASARHSSAGGTSRRQRAARGTTLASVAQRREAHDVAGRPAARQGECRERERDDREAEQEDRRLEAHRRLRPSARSQSPSVLSVTWRARARRSAALSSSRRASSAEANARRSSALAVSISIRAPVSGSIERELARVGQLGLARVGDLDGEHVVPAGERAQRARPRRPLAAVRGLAEVGHDDDEARPARQPHDAAQPEGERVVGRRRAVRRDARRDRAAQRDERVAAAARRQHPRDRRAAREQRDATRAAHRQPADHLGDARGDVGLQPRRRSRTPSTPTRRAAPTS